MVSDLVEMLKKYKEIFLLKIDYNYKAKVLSTDLCKKVNQIDKAIYAKTLLDTTGEIISAELDYDTALRERCFLLEQDERAYKEAEKINKARYKRVKRLRLYLSSMLKKSLTVIFLTLTFDDKTLFNTTEQTRRKYVQRFLSNLSDCYVANIDFGAKNGREHYHAVIDCYVPVKEWSYGHALAEIVQGEFDSVRSVPKRYQTLSIEEQKLRIMEDNEKRLAKYVAKLTNHAIKETNKRCSVIYASPKNRSKTFKEDLTDGYVYHDKKGTLISLIPTEESIPF